MYNNSIIESSIISVGKYEILYGTGLAASFVEDSPKVIQYLNNAKVRYYDVDLKCDIDWKETGKSINSISFLMPRDNASVSYTHLTLPTTERV